MGLGSTNSASEVGMVENVKLNHDLDTNFCNFSPFLRHSAMPSKFPKIGYVLGVKVSMLGGRGSKITQKMATWYGL